MILTPEPFNLSEPLYMFSHSMRELVTYKIERDGRGRIDTHGLVESPHICVIVAIECVDGLFVLALEKDE